MSAGALRVQNRVLDVQGTGALYGYWELKSHPLQEQYLLLTTNPSFQTSYSVLMYLMYCSIICNRINTFLKNLS